jgi:methyl-accepting chemotaxis protein/methyl-accepting chemotaxis protein-1 (serine sensor receptor)
MTQTWTIGRKLYVNAGVLALMTITLGAAGWWGAHTIDGRFEETGTRTARRLALALKADSALAAAFSAQKSMILATVGGDAQETAKQRDKYAKQWSAASGSIDGIVLLVRNDEGRRQMTAIKADLTAYEGFRSSFDGLLDAGQPTEAYRAFEGDAGSIRDRVRDGLAKFVSLQDAWMASDLEGGRVAYTWVRNLTFLVFGAAMLTLAAFVWVVRGIGRQLMTTATALGRGALEVTAASTQVSTSSQALSQGATEQAASLEETSASMEEMASMTRQNAANSQQAATFMVDVERQVQSSNAMLADMVTSMAAIGDASVQVTKIIKTIDEIAFQTNILALNAAVEAARAGEAGMGFAVVADEVRSLAQRSAQAARDTSTLIEASADRARQGGAKVDQVVKSIATITESIVKVKGLVDEVSVASRQQAQGIDQVTQAIAQMEKVTQSTAATAEETAAASEELSAQAQMALDGVATLERMVTRQPATTASADRALLAPRRQPAVSVVRPAAAHSRAEDAIPLDDQAETGTFARF